MHPNTHSPNQGNHEPSPPNQASEASQQHLPKPETSHPSNTENIPPNSPPHTTIQTENEYAILNLAIHSLNLSNNAIPSTPFNSPTSSPDHQVIDTNNSTCNLHHPSLNHPLHNTTNLNHNQGLHQVRNEEADSSFSMTPLWLPLISSDLRWTWVGGDGPFITNGELREAQLDSSETEVTL